MDNLPVRKQMRLENYDYSQNGYYFVTVCTKDRQELFSEIRRGGVLLRPIGEMVEKEINALEKRYGVEIPIYVIMPDHVHLIIKIFRTRDRVEQSPTPTICDMMCAFKSLTTKIANINDNCPGRQIWQRGYYEHVIRNEIEYSETAEYIKNNPLRRELRTHQTANPKQ